MSDADHRQAGPAPASGATGDVDGPVPTGSTRWVISAVMLGFVLVLFYLGARWAQDVAAPWINEGEADITQTVTLQAEASRYRVVTSGPNRPEAIRTACDIVFADGTSRREVAGDGSIVPVEHFGVSRVIEFDAVAGELSVTCEDALSPSSQLGRFQVVEAGGLKQIGAIALGLVAILALLSIATAIGRRLRGVSR